MRVLITGAAGFVGRHLANACAAAGHEPVGVGREPEAPPGLGGYRTADLLDAGAVRAAVSDLGPDAIVHLAALASVPASWSDPRGTLDNNVGATINLLDAVREEAAGAAVVVVGSGEVYGPVPEDRLPVVESEPLRPQNPYAVSKAATDLIAGFYADAHGLRVVRARPFNHVGPAQTDAYVVAAFARQIAEAERAGQGRLELATGNLAPRRDFTDVRDVARSYVLMAATGEPEIFNVCSGVSVPVADILARLAALTDIEVEQHTDPARLRKHEVMDIRGSHDRLTEATGWQPEIALDQTLADTLDWWRSHA